MRGYVWSVYAALGVGLVGGYFLLPAERAGPELYTIVALAAPLAVLLGIVLHGPAWKLPWFVLAGGLGALAAGDAVALLYERLELRASPSPADLVSLLGYPLIAVALVLLVRRRAQGGDWASLLDALTLTAGLGVFLWTFFVGPSLLDQVPGTSERFAPVAYPLADLLVFLVLARLVIVRGLRTPAFNLLTLGLGALLLGDIGSDALSSAAAYGAGSTIDGAWLLGYVCVGSAALHPTMRLIDRPAVAGRERTWAKLALFATASLTAPAALALEETVGGGDDWLVPTLASGLLFLLVLARLAGLIAGHEQAAQREAILREAAISIGAAEPGRIVEVALGAAERLVGDSDGLTVRAIALESTASDLLPGYEAGGRDFVPVPRYVGERLGLPAGTGALLVVPFATPASVRGGMAVATRSLLQRGVRDAVESLGYQVGLALETAELTEKLYRQRSEARFRSLVQNATDVILVVDVDTTIRYQTPSVVSVLGYELEETEGRKLSALVHLDDAPELLASTTRLLETPGNSCSLELRVLRRDGKLLHAEVVGTNLLHDPSVAGIVLTLRDVTERKALEERLAHQAFHDALTNLPNRALFTDRAEHALRRSATIAVLFVDLDDFKTVNDSLGHEEGDRLLVAAAERLGRSVRPQDTVARFGGDEFAVLLEDIDTEEDAVRIAERITAELEAPLPLHGKDVVVRASIGVAVSSRGTSGAAELLRDADVAMYRAKVEGKGRHQVFEAGMHEAALRRFELKAELRLAIDRGQLVLHYQPIVELATGRIVAVEALVRWEHPTRGLIPPDEFVPLAEETGLVFLIDTYVVKQACAQLAELRRSHPHLDVTVNVSMRTLHDLRLVEVVEEALRDAELDPPALVLEITETALMESLETSVEQLQRLRALGVRLAVDDFGTGYSSLSYLRQFPVDILKIARSFVDGMERSPDDRSLAGAIVELASTFGLATIAEGVEQPGQQHLLNVLQCDMAQGFHFDHPLALEELVARLGDGVLAGERQTRPADGAAAA